MFSTRAMRCPQYRDASSFDELSLEKKYTSMRPTFHHDKLKGWSHGTKGKEPVGLYRAVNGECW